jgi:hypothetical protein
VWTKEKLHREVTFELILKKLRERPKQEENWRRRKRKVKRPSKVGELDL